MGSSKYILFPILLLFFCCKRDAPDTVMPVDASIAAEKKDVPNSDVSSVVSNAIDSSELASAAAEEIAKKKAQLVELKKEKEAAIQEQEKEEKVAPEKKVVSTPKPKPAPRPKGMPTMVFDDTVFDYGKIMQGDVVKHSFSFRNTGNAELVITDVKASCGCTQPTFPFLPIMPGEKGVIGAKFDSKGKLGRQKPVITITTNAKPAIHKIYLEGTVDAPRSEKDSIPKM